MIGEKVALLGVGVVLGIGLCAVVLNTGIKKQDAEFQVAQAQAAQCERQLKLDEGFTTECKADLKSCNEQFKATDAAAVSVTLENRQLRDQLRMCEDQTQKAMRRR